MYHSNFFVLFFIIIVFCTKANNEKSTQIKEEENELNLKENLNLK